MVVYVVKIKQKKKSAVEESPALVTNVSYETLKLLRIPQRSAVAAARGLTCVSFSHDPR
jgi:hypothetical protein